MTIDFSGTKIEVATITPEIYPPLRDIVGEFSKQDRGEI